MVNRNIRVLQHLPVGKMKRHFCHPGGLKQLRGILIWRPRRVIALGTKTRQARASWWSGGYESALSVQGTQWVHWSLVREDPTPSFRQQDRVHGYQSPCALELKQPGTRDAHTVRSPAPQRTAAPARHSCEPPRHSEDSRQQINKTF